MIRAAAPMPARRLFGAYVKETKYAFLRFLRNPAFSIPTLAFPPMFYLLVGYLFGGFTAEDPDVPMYLFCGFATMAAMTPGMFGFGIGLALEREQGLLQLKRALPMPPFAALGSNVAMSVLSTFIAVVLHAAVATALGLVSMAPLTLLAMTLTIAAGAIPFSAIGLLLGATVSGRAAPAVVNVLYIVLLYFSGLFIPLPEAIRSVVLASPAFYLHQLTLDVVGAPNYLAGGALHHVAVLVGITVLCLGVATRRLARVG